MCTLIYSYIIEMLSQKQLKLIKLSFLRLPSSKRPISHFLSSVFSQALLSVPQIPQTVVTLRTTGSIDWERLFSIPGEGETGLASFRINPELWLGETLDFLPIEELEEPFLNWFSCLIGLGDNWCSCCCCWWFLAWMRANCFFRRSLAFSRCCFFSSLDQYLPNWKKGNERRQTLEKCKNSRGINVLAAKCESGHV